MNRRRKAACVHLDHEDIQMANIGANTARNTQQMKMGPRRRKRINTAIESHLQSQVREFTNQRMNRQQTVKNKATKTCTEVQPSNKFYLKRLGMQLTMKTKLDTKKLLSDTYQNPLKSNTNGRGSFPAEGNRDINGLTTLHVAAQNNNASKISELVKRGADVDVISSEDYATPLHLAARYNCPEAAMVLIQNGADVTDALINGQTPLHVCCRRGYLNVATVLIVRGKADLNSRDIDMSTPLHQATLNGDIELVTYLVENGADISAMDINNVSPLMQAAQGGFKECVFYLLTLASQVGIPIQKYLSNKDNEGNTALHLAVGNRHIDVARSLIERGAPCNCKKSTNGFTPLHQAAIIGEKALVQMLLDKGAETEIHDKEQMTPLHRAALYNRVDTILLLIRQGLYLDSKDKDNFTPLLCAAWKGQTTAGRSLLRYGADIHVLDMDMKSCLHWAVELQHLEFVRMLFEHGHGGEDLLNLKDRVEQTALHYAAEVGDVEILNLLIQNGAEVVVKDASEKTPLHIASEFGKFECVEALYQACPVPLNDDDINDMTPLLLASENGHHRIVHFLIKVGADIESRNDDRRSPLALAAKNNQMNVLNVLLANNANVNGYDKDQNTALHLCGKEGHEGPAMLLINNGADLRLQNIHGRYPLDLAIEYKRETVAKAILSNNSWEVAMNNIDETGHTPMRRLIAHLPEAALLVMDRCVTKSHEDAYHPDLTITYNYRYIDPGPDDITFDKSKERYFALETMVEFKREKLLAHALSQSNLSSKWKRFARYFNYFDCIIYLWFVVMVSVYLKLNIASRHSDEVVRTVDGCPLITRSALPHLRGSMNGLRSDKNTSDNAHSDDDDLIPLPISNTVVWIQFAILVFVSVRAFREVLDIINLRIRYLKRMDNYLHWALFVVCFAFVFPPNVAPCDIQWIAGVIAVFVSWMNFIFVLNRFDFFGLYVTMFFTTLKSLLKAMSVYVFFIVGFGLAFFICFEATNETFRNEWSSILTIFVMTLGEINKSDLLDTGESLHPFEQVSNFLLVILLFLMPMVLINLTIGISVGDIEQILQSSYFKRFSLQVDIILGIEKKLPRRFQRTAWLPTGEYMPNKPKSAFVRKIKPWLGSSSTKFLRKSREETHKEISIGDVMNKVSKHDQALSSLTMLVREQGRLLSRIAEKHDIKVVAEPSFSLPTSPTNANTTMF